MSVLTAQELFLNPDDLSVELRVPAVNATDCKTPASFDFAGVTVTRRLPLGIYGPGPAHTHEDWIGSDGVATPDSGGQFTVTGAGELMLTLASNYDQRNLDVPALTSAGSPPTVGFYRRADCYYAIEEIHEARYCWLGVERLAWTLTAPAACTLTVVIAYHQHLSTTDLHVTDSTRSTEWLQPDTELSKTFAVNVPQGEAVSFLKLLEGAEMCLFEQVVSITVSGFANGAWTLTEPQLADGEHVQSILKTFEGWTGAGRSDGEGGTVYPYTHGGASAHSDAAFEGLYATRGDSNAGHRNKAEWTVPFFDYRESVDYVIDLTTAWSLSDFCGIMSLCQEVFDLTENTTVTDAATVDAEAPPNTLTGLYAFDICFPNASQNEENYSPPVLEQSIAGSPGAANVSIRCNTWTIAAGIECLIVTDKIVGGRPHGRALNGARLRRAVGTLTKLWRHPPGETTWEFVGNVGSDICGHWSYPTLPEAHDYDGTAPDVMQRWVYGVGGSATSAVEIGEVFAREYTAHEAFGRGQRPWLTTDWCGRTWLAAAIEGTVHIWSAANPGAWANFRERPHVAEGEWTRPTIMVMSTGWVYVSACDGDGLTHLWQSWNDGATWEAVT